MSAPLAPVEWSHSVWHLEITKLLSVVVGAKVAECFVSDCFTYESDVAVGEKVWVVDKAHPLPVAQKVAGKATVKEVGLHSPVLTHGGMPIVGGFVTAFDSIEVVKTAEAGLPALLAMCKATKTCDLLKGAFKFNNRPHVAVEA